MHNDNNDDDECNTKHMHYIHLDYLLNDLTTNRYKNTTKEQILYFSKANQSMPIKPHRVTLERIIYITQGNTCSLTDLTCTSLSGLPS